MIIIVCLSNTCILYWLNIWISAKLTDNADIFTSVEFVVAAALPGVPGRLGFWGRDISLEMFEIFTNRKSYLVLIIVSILIFC